jgi:hypothetical protein
MGDEAEERERVEAIEGVGEGGKWERGVDVDFSRKTRPDRGLSVIEAYFSRVFLGRRSRDKREASQCFAVRKAVWDCLSDLRFGKAPRDGCIALIHLARLPSSMADRDPSHSHPSI